MLRSLLIIATVATISAFLSHLEVAQAERAQTERHVQTAIPAWVRTVDGWEPSSVLTAEPGGEISPALHPLLVASFQVAASVFVLLAFPYSKSR